MLRLRRPRLSDLDEVGEWREVLRVPGEKRDAVDVRGGCDDEIDGATTRLAATCDQCRCEPPPFPRNSGIDGKRIESRLDNPESLRPPCPFVIGGSDQYTEVQLGKRRGADRTLQLAWALGPDQNRCIEKDPHLRERIDEPAGETDQIVLERLRRRRLPDTLQTRTADPLPWSSRAEPGDWTTRHCDGELFACLGAPENLTDVVPKLLLRDGRHSIRVAVLLPMEVDGGRLDDRKVCALTSSAHCTD